MDKAKGGKIQGGSWGWVGQGGVVVGKWRQLYLNNKNKKEKKKKNPLGKSNRKMKITNKPVKLIIVPKTLLFNIKTREKKNLKN